jgi:Glycosyl hydrolase family 76
MLDTAGQGLDLKRLLRAFNRGVYTVGGIPPAPRASQDEGIASGHLAQVGTPPPAEKSEPVRVLTPAENSEPAVAPTENNEPSVSIPTRPSRLRRRLTALVITLMIWFPASLALADAAGPIGAYVSPPPPVANCQMPGVRCGAVQQRAEANRAAARAKLPAGAVLNAATNGMRELLGFGDPNNPLRWDPNTGLWGGYTSYATSDAHPAWWQSAIATWTLVRYLEATGSADPAYQDVLDHTFELNVVKPGSRAPVNFANEYMDDTAWWGLAWTEAARYELNVRGDSALAARYLAVAEWDENYIAKAPRSCGGIVWQLGYPSDTISNAEFAALSADLYAIRNAPGPFHDAATAARWFHEARWALIYMRTRHLTFLRSGTVHDGLTRGCRPVAGPLTYTEGEVADAYIQMGVATHNNGYFADARAFLNYTLWRGSGMSRAHVLQEYCESRRAMCHGLRQFDVSSFKGIFAQAMADYDLATASETYRPWLQLQAAAIIRRAISDGSHRTSCRTPHSCQFGLYWSRYVPPASAPVPVSLASQTSALQALTAVLADLSGFDNGGRSRASRMFASQPARAGAGPRGQGSTAFRPPTRSG